MIVVHWPNHIFIALAVNFIKLLQTNNQQQKSYSGSNEILHHDFIEENKSKLFSSFNRLSVLTLYTKTPKKIHNFVAMQNIAISTLNQTHHRWSVYKTNVKSHKINVTSPFPSQTWISCLARPRSLENLHPSNFIRLY